jgi:hypothetical protein
MSVLTTVLRWTARVSGLLVAGAYAYLMIGEMAASHSGPPSTVLEWTGIALLTIAAFALPFGWRWELPAGLLSLAALALQAALISGSTTYHRALLTMAAPAILYCLDWLVRRESIRLASRSA